MDQADLLLRYDRAAPRYTSYPTVPHWDERFGAAGADAALDRHRAAAAEGEAPPLALYAHVPFCHERCRFCACNVVIDPHRRRAPGYLDAIEREIELAARRLGPGLEVAQLHLGGGTPTFLDPDELERLVGSMLAPFVRRPDAKFSVEVDPMVTSTEHLERLRRLGFTRISAGVQDLDPDVQRAVNRIQSLEDNARFVAACRAAGFESVNLDLIYGLPQQTPARFAHTLERLLAWRPDRVALFNYAHVPWMHAHQRLLDASTLPSPREKLEIFLAARERFHAEGYVAIGMDHFARRGDELARAAERGLLRRNFMGYTVGQDTATLAFGTSAISDIGGAFYQNDPKLVGYERAVLEGRLPARRGMRLSPDDQRRARIIHDILCRGELRFAEHRVHGTAFHESYATELSALEPLVEDGLLEMDDAGLRLTDLGRLLPRNAAMPFDRYLRDGAKPQVRYSRTV